MHQSTQTTCLASVPNTNLIYALGRHTVTAISARSSSVALKSVRQWKMGIVSTSVVASCMIHVQGKSPPAKYQVTLEATLTGSK
eukprot:6185411-Pleurochrysis_carterae.AAC.7